MKNLTYSTYNCNNISLILENSCAEQTWKKNPSLCNQDFEYWFGSKRKKHRLADTQRKDARCPNLI
jgi:hypothetical protein